MRARAPGKLVLTGAYAVLEGAPAIVVAVDRYAVADAARAASSAALEVRAALPEGEPVPDADARGLCDAQGRKLGLGSSAAVLVASLAARALTRGEDVEDRAVRARLFASARVAHASAQGGGSGVDVAASVYGGVLRYAVGNGEPQIRVSALPPGLVFQVYFGGSSARTSAMRELVASARVVRADETSPVAEAMAKTATRAADAFESRDTAGFIALACEYGSLLALLGRAAQAPIVLPVHAELAADAQREGAAFLPSGAGGGDVAVWLGSAPPSHSFSARARALALVPITLSVDVGGVRRDSAQT